MQPPRRASDRPEGLSDAKVLEAIRNAAAQGTLQIGRHVGDDIADLDHTIEDVLELIAGCSLEELRSIHPARQTERWPDHYHYAFHVAVEPDWVLYIKFAVCLSDLSLIELTSYKDRDSPI